MLGNIVERKENAYVLKRKIMLRIYSSPNPVKNYYCTKLPTVNITWLPAISALVWIGAGGGGGVVGGEES